MFLNGKSTAWTKPTITHHEIAHLVGRRGADLTVTFRCALGKSGELHAGDVIAVTPDLVLNAYATGAA